MADEDLTPRQVAEALGTTPRTVQRWIAQGRLPAVRVGGRMRVSRSSLAAFSSSTAHGGEPPQRRIRSLLIANRGEIAVRIARSAHRLGIRVVGVTARDERPPEGLDATATIDSYLDGQALIDAARELAADAVHPGYGFLSENAGFARAVVEAGLTWVGPPAEAIAVMGDKAAARRRAAQRDVPVLPGYDGADQTDAALIAEAERVGVPLLVKPSAGGGGKGMRVVRQADELAEALAAARREAARAFGDDRLILERYLDGPRHVEIQVLFDAHGHGVSLGERDCSTQRRQQKIVEEAPAPSVDAELRERMGAAALAVASSVGYVGAGTVEFLLADAGDFYFLEMNTRLQVEHPVTEAVTGRDLVADQLRIAEGHELEPAAAYQRLSGHAIEARLYAEDPESGFLPATGRLLRLDWPDGVRIDTGVRQGDEITDRYDPLLAKLIATGATRAEAVTRLRDALERTTVLGVRTNLRFLRWLLAQPAMRDGEMRTDTLSRLALPTAPAIDEAAWTSAANLLAPDDGDRHAAWGGGWRLNAPRQLRLRHASQERLVAIGPAAARPGAVDPSGAEAFVEVEGQSLEFRMAPAPTVEDALRQASASDAAHATLIAPMPGRVLALRVAEGASVREHEPVIVIEAMKMEHAVVSPLEGQVTRLVVREGAQVQRGDVLAEVERIVTP
jgi:acetyl-CoA/propionyl-CoA carboxylase biotin carboxyl carrier protein